MFVDLLAEQFGVDGRMVHHERRAETRRKRGLGFGDPALRAGNLRGVTREEVVHRLLFAEPADGRKRAEGVGRQHDDRARVAGAAAGNDVRDELDRIRAARVFSLCL